ncbi:acetaldehyde dehydrogenase [Effusibacillus lacus]|uniref:Acetaldehyde dehydrogenase n=1 Tax=Effusibacillus lacus TaxID=1348429 RepID=A0A292YS27_9BACL|nr:acetaldehyde dehydrogenase [Effusibacillus lacus]
MGIIGSGNIGTDLMYKILRSSSLELSLMAGVDPDSEGLSRARSMGIPTSTESIDAILADKEIQIVFDATSAKAHLTHAPLLKEAGKIAIDLTPASVGDPVVPVVNLNADLPLDNISLITCGAQATVPMVYAVSRVAEVNYAEIVATVSSRSAGPGTRANIDEFTRATARSLEQVGGAKRGKALIILNPAEPPIMMTNTIYVNVLKGVEATIVNSVNEMVAEVQKYVPGYKLKVPPLVEHSPTGEGIMVTIMVEVEGAGDYLPKYAGNLDIITSAAVRVAEKLGKERVTVS